MIQNDNLDLQEGAGIRTAVDIVIFNKQNQILLGKRLVNAGKNTWGFPGGHQKTGEKILETAQREIKEELGEKVDIQFTKQIISVRENFIPPTMFLILLS